ncbi:anti-sigma-E factor RseA [Erwinia sp. CPCC 100877]|nr:anti-sigma-E factor RseA [Erwinia sp. CPCC 100877]
MQKEQLSALMDGETLDSELLTNISGDERLQETWRSYHLIRDAMRGDTSGNILNIDVSAGVMAAIASEPVRRAVPSIEESQPAPHQWQKMPFWKKMRPWASHITQIGVAACVSLAVIVGVQQYNAPEASGVGQPEAPAFNTLPMMGKASPVSLGVPYGNEVSGRGGQQQLQEQRRRINAMLQDYELQRRLHAEQLHFDQSQNQQAALRVPGNQSLGSQSR